jgi:hypothetical protein
VVEEHCWAMTGGAVRHAAADWVQAFQQYSLLHRYIGDLMRIKLLLRQSST